MVTSMGIHVAQRGIEITTCKGAKSIAIKETFEWKNLRTFLSAYIVEPFSTIECSGTIELYIQTTIFSKSNRQSLMVCLKLDSTEATHSLLLCVSEANYSIVPLSLSYIAIRKAAPCTPWYTREGRSLGSTPLQRCSARYHR